MSDYPILLVFKRKSSSDDQVHLVFGQSDCPPDWLPATSDNIEVKFESCRSVAASWQDEDVLNLDFSLYNEWYEDNSGIVDFDFLEFERIPDWVYEQSDSLVINFTCCEGTQQVEIRGNSTTTLSLSVEQELELGSLPEIEGVSEIIVGVNTPGYGMFGRDGNSSILVSVSSSGSGVRELYGDGRPDIVSLNAYGSGYKDSYGYSTNLVSLDTSGFGTKQTFGYSSVSVTVTPSGSGYIEKTGVSTVYPEIFSFGTGTKQTFGYSVVPVGIVPIGIGYSEKFGSSNVLVSVVPSGTGSKQAYGYSSVVVSVGVLGTGIKDIYGRSSVLSSVDVSGTGYIEKKGYSNVTISVDVSSEGIKDNWSESETPVTVISTGTGIKDAAGVSSVSISVSSLGRAQKDIGGQAITPISVSSIGTLDKDNWLGSETVVKVTTSGEGTKWNWGYGSTSVSISDTGIGFKDSWGNSSTLISVSPSGLGTKDNWSLGLTFPEVISKGAGTKELWANSDNVIYIDSPSLAWKEAWGREDKIVNLISNGDGQLSPLAYSSIIVTLETRGLGKIVGGVTLVGKSSNTVSIGVSSKATKFGHISGNSSCSLDISTYGNNINYPGLSGNGRPVVFTLSTNGSGQIKKDIKNTDSNVPVNVISSGHANNLYSYENIVGDSAMVLLSILTESLGTKNEKQQAELKLLPIFESKEKIQFVVNMIVDIEKQQYEIRNVETNRDYLDDFRLEKRETRLKIGTSIKDVVQITEDFESYNTDRKTILRKYGCSEVTLCIDIESTYKFIRNPVNIIKLVENEVDRAILDSYALYEFEFE